MKNELKESISKKASIKDLLEAGLQLELSYQGSRREHFLTITKIRNGYFLRINYDDAKSFYFANFDDIPDFILRTWGKEWG